ncbi:Ig-like domain-containing protein [Treponema sp. C6A8]|uniref:Ig-like domain-containing protein n=1 Tax=Treponema sp. C6A8 TaxID=1410609 RepID=UPI0006844BA8|nr:Ig-like domain-containing protein [Treponema sp. C6A8]
MFKRLIKLLILFSLTGAAANPLFAQFTSPKVENITAKNLNSWQDSFDLDKRKNGKYNILITAKDLGGNTTVEGPHNIWLDPKSDLPVCTITNPYPDMRVSGNLNIVGTCVDDDGVAKVKLILDEGRESELRVDAQGKEFWSYYLDTTNLEEGDHTIKVIGYDINALQIEGNPTIVNWKLDRKLPVTSLYDKEMGMLVSGKVNFKGLVTDGNGIKKLEVSTDGGQHFSLLKLKKLSKRGSECEFAFDLDTKKFNDGPNVIWFRATDETTSVGLYSFLYFIDNTNPDVKIVSPAEGEIKNGKFSVAGYAKDKIGVTSLTWTFGNESGEFELIPGNPYWKLDLNTIGLKEKAVKFAIHAVDRAGNITDVVRNIPLNQENDKPVVEIKNPAPDQAFGGRDSFVVRGFAKDDDALASVKIVIDGNQDEAFIQETRGAFSYTPELPEGLKTGKHFVTVTGIDENGIEGNPVTVNFYSVGLEAEFSDARISSGKEALDFVNGMEVHPESGSTFEVTANSTVGIKSVHKEIRWGKDGVASYDDTFAKPSLSQKITLPITPDFPKGVLQLVIQTTDIADRVSEFRGVLYVTNTTTVKASEPSIVLDDSRIDEDGTIINNPEFPASAYFIGAYATKVELVPPTPFAKAELDGNQIKLVAGDAVGGSEDVKIRVTADNGKTFESKVIRFKSDTALPEIALETENTKLIKSQEPISVKGKITCETGVGKAYYKVLSAVTEIKAGLIGAVHTEAKEEVKIELAKGGDFSFEINPQDFEDGVHVIEIIAESAGGNKSANAIAFEKLPEIEEVNGKLPSPKAPIISWLDDLDVYAVGLYQGNFAEESDTFMIFPRSEMAEGNNALTMSVLAEDGKAPVVGKYTAAKAPSLEVNIAKVNDADYLSGMPVVVPYGVKEAAKIQLYIKSSVAVGGVSYEITGDEVTGGDLRQAGSARLIKPAPENPDLWIAEIPLGNLPVRVNNFTATVKAGSLSKTVKGAVSVVRDYPRESIEDSEKIFGFAAGNTGFDEENGNYILSDSSKYYFYANLMAPLRVELVSKTEGLKIETDGNLITLSAEKDGYYSGVYVRVHDQFGNAYESARVNFDADTSAPVVNLVEPVFAQWLGNTLKVSGTAADPSGIAKAEYSFDGGETWEEFPLSPSKNPGATFSTNASLKEDPDGLICIDIRATDFAGKTSYVHTACFKDVTPPDATVIVPTPEDIVNGETLIVFDIKDNGHLNKAEYVAPPVKGKQPVKNPIELAPLTSVLIGTEANPIDDAMSFLFTDDAGNTSSMELWDFMIDQESDLPIAEIHVPEEMQIITRDFTISGVVYDDDGDSTIFYKIDNNPYTQLPEQGTSFAIDIPLLSLTDNEHTVTVYAVDINGVKGPETTRTFRISLEEPKGAVELPTIDTHNRDRITISGWSSDKNGIEKVEVSLDSGNSYNDAIGTEKWHYDVDTRAINGGTQVVFLKITDKYGIQGLYSSIINIDNAPPEINLELPLDDSTTTGNLFFSGFTYDNVEITELYATIRNLDKSGRSVVRKLQIDRVVGETIDISDLENGFYNIEVTGKDKAGNATNVSRNIHLDKNKQPATVDILYPLNGEHKNGLFTIYGQSEGEFKIDHLNLYLDNQNIAQTELTSCGFFKFDMGPENMTEGLHTYKVGTVLEGGKEIISREQTITYSPVGPWITIDNFTYGDFAINRPYIYGRAGYSISEDEVLLSKTKEVSPEQKAITDAKRVAKVEISFDNGKTFIQVSKKQGWEYRIENEDLPEGYHFLLIRAVMVNGEIAVTRTIIQVDNTKPSIRLITPERGGRYNQVLDVSGLSNDNVELSDVTLTLRKGDKAAYEVPSFIQGLYLDFHFWGATLFELGAGLTFFDDNVKLQVEWGQFTQEQRDSVSDLFGIAPTGTRYGGNVFGLKILANIVSIPFSYFFGRDFEWLYASAAIGAQFSWFDLTQSRKTQTLSALVGQIELPKVKLKNAKMFSTFAFYFEGSLWFIPTDVASSVEIQSIVPQFAIGLRTNIF